MEELLNKLPKALYSGGLYIQYDMNGLWYCGYQNSVYHTSNMILKEALEELLIKIENYGRKYY